MQPNKRFNDRWGKGKRNKKDYQIRQMKWTSWPGWKRFVFHIEFLPLVRFVCSSSADE